MIFFDFETRSSVPINRGTDCYMGKAEALICTYARDDQKARLWDIIGGETIPKDLADAFADPTEILVAHNCAFDRAALIRLCRIYLPISRFRCSMAQAYAHGYPGSLEALGEVLKLPHDQKKLVDDAKLIQLFCVPYPDGTYADRHSHPAEWERFCGYGLRDTETLREINKRLPAHNYRDINLKWWWLNQLEVERGFQLDLRLATAAREVLQKAKKRHDGDMHDATEGEVETATQRRLLGYLRSQGIELPNLRAATIREWLEHDDLDPTLRLCLELRLEASQSSGAKFRRGLEIAGADGRARYCIQFSGAGRTGRNAGRNFQPHNMPRYTYKHDWIEQAVLPAILDGSVLDDELLYGGPNEACKNALRSVITASEGCSLYVVDWSNIEGVILAWVCGEESELEVFRATARGEDVDGYKLLGAEIFQVPPSEVTDDQRQITKVVKLSLGYLGSVGAFVAMSANYNLDLDTLPPTVLPRASEKQLKKAYRAWLKAFLIGEDLDLQPDTYAACHILVQMYREKNAKIFETGHEVGKACINALKSTGTVHHVAKCKIWNTPSFLIIELPSGRRLLYADARIELKTELDIETGDMRTSEYVTYRTARGKGWMREKAWAGLFIENIVQAIANDVMRAGGIAVHNDTWSIPVIRDYLLAKTRERGYDESTALVMDVHDELVVDAPKGSYDHKRMASKMTGELVAAHAWMQGMPLAAKGWTGQRYRK